jgi:hypothetical protein
MSGRSHVTIYDLARQMNSSPSALIHRAQRGELPGAFQLGDDGPWRIPRATAERLIAETQGAGTVATKASGTLQAGS